MERDAVCGAGPIIRVATARRGQRTCALPGVMALAVPPETAIEQW